MLFGMTRGELGLVLFIFALVYGASFIPKVGNALGTFLHKRLGRSAGDDEARPRG